jgi:hypothetical protein
LRLLGLFGLVLSDRCLVCRSFLDPLLFDRFFGERLFGRWVLDCGSGGLDRSRRWVFRYVERWRRGDWRRGDGLGRVDGVRCDFG